MKVGVDLVGENDQTQAVPLAQGRAGHQDRGFEHGIELRSVAAIRRERPAGIHEEHDLLMTLDLEVPADRPAQPRGGLPVDPANVVLGTVFPQRFKRRAGAAPAIAMASRLPQRRTPLRQLGRLGVRQVGQTGNLQAGRQPLLRPGKTQTAREFGSRDRRRRPCRARKEPARNATIVRDRGGAFTSSVGGSARAPSGTRSESSSASGNPPWFSTIQAMRLG